ncbi:CLUMA_CG011387, isoform A [Clunio marinus]|uniref:CLUMA_CG011387, isoform A n=1 Tax=Clunio marinus TaxID=568069 RepID=A0A1J1IE23_9DIPT|nr:CLUMA_CG011387, isoform A [Clunio marinus]
MKSHVSLSLESWKSEDFENLSALEKAGSFIISLTNSRRKERRSRKIFELIKKNTEFSSCSVGHEMKRHDEERKDEDEKIKNNPSSEYSYSLFEMYGKRKHFTQTFQITRNTRRLIPLNILYLRTA